MLDEKVIITENGNRKTITKREAAFKQLANKAAGGDARTIHLLLAELRIMETKAESLQLGIPIEVFRRILEVDDEENT